VALGHLGVALEIASSSPDHEEKYAEHAYVHARMDGFDVTGSLLLVEDAAVCCRQWMYLFIQNT